MRRVLVLIATLAAATPAAGQLPTADTLSAARLQAAGDLIEAMDAEETMRRGMELMMDVGPASMAPGGPGMAQREEHQRIIRRYMDRMLDWSELQDDVARLYAEAYTVDQMRQLEAFYRSPLGRLVIETTPELTAGMQRVMMRRMQTIMPEMMRELMAEMQDDMMGGGAGGAEDG